MAPARGVRGTSMRAPAAVSCLGVAHALSPFSVQRAGRGEAEPEFAWRPHLAGAARACGLPRRVAWPLRLHGEPAGDAPARSELLKRLPDLQVLCSIWPAATTCVAASSPHDSA